MIMLHVFKEHTNLMLYVFKECYMYSNSITKSITIIIILIGNGKGMKRILSRICLIMDIARPEHHKN